MKEPGSITYISGLAGRGKTTLALEYAYQYQRDLASVHWLPCHGRSLVQIAGELTIQLGLKLEGDVDTIVRELNGHSARKRCLLILDNVEDDAPAQLLPGGRTSVLITTRLTDLTFLDFHKPIQLPLFTEAQCFELFGDVIGREEVEKHTDEARALFRRVEYLPIAIAVAAKLIRKDVRYTIAGMAKNLPRRCNGSPQRGRVRSVATSPDPPHWDGGLRPRGLSYRTGSRDRRTKRDLVARCPAGNLLTLARRRT